MKKSIKITLWSICGVIIALVITLCVLLCLGFRFTPEAAVNGVYQDNTQISTEEYIFYLNDVTNSDNGEIIFATSHVAAKKCGFLYKNAKKSDLIRCTLVAENGDRVGTLFSYEGDGQIYHFIHWTLLIDDSVTPPESDIEDDSVSAYATMKYCTDNIIVNGVEKELYHYCYFITDEPIETLTIKGTNVSVIDSETEK